MVFMIDDMNLSRRDKWGHTSHNELIRQFLNHGGWYQNKSLSYRRVKDINFVSVVSLRNEKELIE